MSETPEAVDKNLVAIVVGIIAAVLMAVWKADAFLLLFASAWLIEAFMEVFKHVYEPLHPQAKRMTPIIVVAVGASICTAIGFDIFSMAGLPLPAPYLGTLLTGVCAGRIAIFQHTIGNAMTAKYEAYKASLGKKG